MQRILQLRWLFLIVMVVLAACGGGPATPEPAKIRFGETICTECGMIISQPKYASSFAYAESEGRFKSLPFDDIGDMLTHMRQHPELIPAGVWVHDYNSEEWIDAEDAFFVVSTRSSRRWVTASPPLPTRPPPSALPPRQPARCSTGITYGSRWQWRSINIRRTGRGGDKETGWKSIFLFFSLSPLIPCLPSPLLYKFIRQFFGGVKDV